MLLWNSQLLLHVRLDTQLNVRKKESYFLWCYICQKHTQYIFSLMNRAYLSIFQIVYLYVEGGVNAQNEDFVIGLQLSVDLLSGHEIIDLQHNTAFR